jgi:hypothetical protein
MNKAQIDKLKEIGIKPSEVPSQLKKRIINNTLEQIKPKHININLSPFIYMGKCIESEIASGIFGSPKQINGDHQNVFLLNDGRLVLDFNVGVISNSYQNVIIKKEGNKLVNLQNNNNITGKKGFYFTLDVYLHEKTINNCTLNKRNLKGRENKSILDSMTNEQCATLKKSKIKFSHIPIQNKKNVFQGSHGLYIYMGKLDESETTLKANVSNLLPTGRKNINLTGNDRMVFLKPNGYFVINKKIPSILSGFGFNDFDQTAKLKYENSVPKQNNDGFIFELDVLNPSSPTKGGRKSKKPTKKPVVKKPVKKTTTTKPVKKPVKKTTTTKPVKKPVKKPTKNPDKKPIKKSTKKPKKTKSLTNQFMNLFK